MYVIPENGLSWIIIQGIQRQDVHVVGNWSCEVKSKY